MSSHEAPYSMAKPASAIISPALGPMMWTPRTLWVSASAMNLTKPSVSMFVLALELATNGNLPVLYLMPAAFSSSSFLPVQATSGWLYMTAGMLP